MAFVVINSGHIKPPGARFTQRLREELVVQEQSFNTLPTQIHYRPLKAPPSRQGGRATAGINSSGGIILIAMAEKIAWGKFGFSAAVNQNGYCSPFLTPTRALQGLRDVCGGMTLYIAAPAF